MRFLFRKHEPGQIEFALIYGGLAILLLAAARFLPVADMAPDCAFRTLTGLPCPTCGSTRCVTLLSEGRILAALAMNPLIAAVWGAALVAFVYRIAAMAFDFPRIELGLSSPERTTIRLLAIVLVLADWAYLISVL